MLVATRRFLRILHVGLRHRLDTLLPARALPKPVRLGLWLFPARWRRVPNQSRGERLQRALEELGPVFIKFGQALSTRRDLLPADLADALARLQDNVAPFPGEEARAIIEDRLGKPIDSLFHHFDPTPLASASVAQVHAAELPNGRRVVVKVIRPGIAPVIDQDLVLLDRLARLLERFHPDGYRLRPRDVVADYRHTILDELDLLREAANTSQLRRHFEGSDRLYVPEVVWHLTRRDVLTLERIHGIPVSDIAALRDAGTNLKVLAERGVEIFFTQVFKHNFFHADMHPGNVFVNVTDPEHPGYIGIDCAIIGTLSEADQYYLARNLLAIFQRDYRLVAELHVECGWVSPDTPVGEFEAAIRSVCEPVFEKPLAEISFGQLLVYLFQTARRFDMTVQPSLVLLQKTLLHIEGLGRDLYPELDLWATAKPFLENWLRERYSPRAMTERLRRYAPGWLEQLPSLPDRITRALDRLGEAPALAAAERDTYCRQLKRERRWRWALLTGLLASLAAHWWS